MTLAPPAPQRGPAAKAETPPAPSRRPATGNLSAISSLLGAAAVIGGSTALVPLVQGTAWLSPIVTVVAVIYVVGLGARALAMPAWLVELAQVGAYCIALTHLFTTTGIAGLLPGRAAVEQGGAMLSAAWHQVMVTEPPAPATIELSFLIAIAIGAVALLVDMLIALAKTPALAALPLLGLYAVPASIAPGLLPWYAFVLPAIGYALTMAASKPRPVPWHGRSLATLTVSAAVITTIAVMGSLVATTMATGIGTEGRIPHEGGSSGTVHINPWAQLHGDLTRGNPRDALRVSGLDSPAYLRTFALTEWVPGQGFRLGALQPDSPITPGEPLSTAPVGSRLARATVTPQHYHDRYLPVYLDTVSVADIDDAWNYDRDQETVFRRLRTTPGPYVVTTAVGALTATQLRTDTVHSGGPLTETGALPDRVVNLAESITTEARTPFDKAAALLHYFTDPANGFTYSLHVPVGSSGSALVDFLTTKQGYCEQYAASMAIMARAIGLPARVGVGFTQGTLLADGSRQITSADAHAWVEIRFDRAGWIVFDPTPPHHGQGGIQGFIPDAADQGNDGAPGGAESSSPGSASTSADQTGGTTQVPPTPTEQLSAASPSRPDSAAVARPGTPSWVWWLVAVAGIVALVALLWLPTLIRTRRRRRRMGQVQSGLVGAGSAAWDELADTLIDHRFPRPRAQSPRSVARELAQQAALSASDHAQLHAVVASVEREWYSDGMPTEVHDPDALAAGLTVGINAAAAAGADRRWFDRLWPRSLGRSRRHH